MNRLPELSVVLPTYNRAADLSQAVESVLRQTAPPETYELIVVNNNSSDDTSGVLERLTREHPNRIRAILESKQGVAHARNAGIEASRAAVIAFFDDDVSVAPNWIETILRLFAEHPELDCVGGKVLPAWSSAPPAWLTPAHWAPLALQDFGDAPMVVSLDNPKGLISANLACRKEVFHRVGGFLPQFQRVKDGIGSLEDGEWMLRFWKSGGRALYTPDLVTSTDVPAARQTRAYHRRWHLGHGYFYGLLRAEDMERTAVGSLFGVPAHMYRSAVQDATRWCRAAVSGADSAFLYEIKLRFFAGFLRQRVRERFSLRPPLAAHHGQRHS